MRFFKTRVFTILPGEKEKKQREMKRAKTLQNARRLIISLILKYESTAIGRLGIEIESESYR